jgi:hypothetical protein
VKEKCPECRGQAQTSEVEAPFGGQEQPKVCDNNIQQEKRKMERVREKEKEYAPREST